MGALGQTTTSDYIEFSDFQKLLKDIHEAKEYRWEAFLTISFVTGLRISDTLQLKWSDLLGAEGLAVTEKKTGKKRNIKFSGETMDKIKQVYESLRSPKLDSHIFTGRNGRPFTQQYTNRELKRIKEKYGLKIECFSSHSLRKTFARHIWEMNGRSEEALVWLMQILNHTSIATTRIYLGIRGEEIERIYKSIKI